MTGQPQEVEANHATAGTADELMQTGSRDDKGNKEEVSTSRHDSHDEYQLLPKQNVSNSEYTTQKDVDIITEEKSVPMVDVAVDDVSIVASIEPNSSTGDPILHADACVQHAPSLTSNSSQTKWHRKVNKVIQYEALELSDFGIDRNVQEEVLESLKRVTPLFERALQENEVVDIFADYLDIPEKGDISIIRSAEDDDSIKALVNFTDLVFGKGKVVQLIDVHPANKDIVAVSVCETGIVDESSSSPAYILLWRFNQTRPQCILKAPLDCPVFRFNPTQPHLIVGGCRNGTVLLWDTSNHLNEAPSSQYRDQETDASDGNENDRAVVMPEALSLPEHGHTRMVADICWLPAHVQINSRGCLLDKAYTSDTSSQFFTVSGDGQIIFWDVRYRDIMAGKLPHIAKIKQSKQALDSDQDFPMMKWMPLFKIKPKRLEGTGELSLCKVLFPSTGSRTSFKASQIICASEEGDLLSVDWRPKMDSGKDGNEKEQDREFASQEYVQWMKQDHNRPCISLSQSTFFPEFALTTSDWNFHIWRIDGDSSRIPVYSSPNTNSFITGGQWSPTRPGVIYISKTDGAIDIWDFVTEGCYDPQTSVLIPNSIAAMTLLTGPNNNQKLAVGDNSGSLHIFEVPRNLAHPYPNEQALMKTFLDRETKCNSMNVETTASEAGEILAELTTPSSATQDQQHKQTAVGQPKKEKIDGLTEEEDALYLEMEQHFLAT